MLDWIAQNIGTIATGLVLAGILAAIVAKIARDRRKGKPVGCGCGNCPNANECGEKKAPLH